MTEVLPTPAELLPHGAGMVLLDQTIALDEAHAECAVLIDTGTRFFEAGRGVPNWVGIEYMAQCAGVHANAIRVRTGLSVQIGLLLGTRAYICDTAWFEAGHRLLVRAELIMRDGEGLGAYDCVICDGEAVVARAQIKAYQPENVDTVLEQLLETRI